MRLFESCGTAAFAACLFACSNTVMTSGQGGTTGSTTSSKTGTGQTTTGQTSTTQTATGQTGTTTAQTGATTTTSQTGTTSVASTGTGMVNQHCTNTCTKGDQLSTQLGCTPDTGCLSTCEQVYTMYPQCSAQMDAFFDCLLQQVSAQTCQCDSTSMNKMKCNGICTQEAGALSTCVQGG